MSDLTLQQSINIDAVLRARPIDEIMADLLGQIKNLVTLGIIPETTAINVASNDIKLQPLITEVLIIHNQSTKNKELVEGVDYQYGDPDYE